MIFFVFSLRFFFNFRFAGSFKKEKRNYLCLESSALSLLLLVHALSSLTEELF